MFKKILSLALVVVMCASLCVAMVSCSGDQVQGDDIIESPLPLTETTSSVKVPDDFKIGFIFLHDENSTYDANFINAAKRVQKVFNLKDEQVVFKKNIGENDDCYSAAIDLADQGCKIVFADSFGHEGYLIQAAKDRPNTQFCHATGTRAHTEGLSNFHNAFASIYEGRFLAGIAAGLKLNEMIESGKITADKAVMGYVGAFTYAEVISGLTSFYLGAKYVCPSVTMKVQFTGSWYDEAKEQEAANALMSKSCVLISQHADSMGAPSACEVKGVPNVSYNGSTVSACPETFIISSAINWTPYLQYIIETYVQGGTIAADWCGGIDEGAVVLSDINGKAAAAGTKEKITEAIAALKNGTLKVFDTTTFTVEGKQLTSYLADVNYDESYTKDTEAIKNGAFAESSDRSAPYFDICIDGIEFLNSMY